ncbi:Hydroxyindole-O-methyltransferase [Handroanthus impetiginosus]|uniref:Hydroxyindole-O-methyltransferase n=1 Tax=Handroanthus impetiginosus TaxID=429701 RepID=A0A2G9I930_9LAMI|nr:Hydroxyindole-O-methyltransferase [Handroanthus impetiginosus]
MALTNKETSSQLLDAQTYIWNHTFNFVSSMSLKCVVQLEIPDLIHKHGKPMTLSQIINGLPIDKAKAHHVHRLMRILVHSGFFTKVNIFADEENEGYWLTPSSRLLLTDEPFSVRPLLLAKLNPFLMEPWHYVSKWFKNNHHKTAFDMTYRRTRWDTNDGGQNSSTFDHLFNEAMAGDARLEARVLIKDLKHVFEGLESIVDVGGGKGALAKAIADAFPKLKCTVLDLPHVVCGLEGAANLSYVGANMFEFIPHANAILMKEQWILHCWSDEECIKILKKCKEAIPNKEKGGKVIIIEMVLPSDPKRDHKAFETQLLFDMEDMILVPGRERTEKEWAKLFLAADFTSYNIFPILGLRSVIEVCP